MPSLIISRNSQFVRVSPLSIKTFIGRSPDNDIVLDGTGISRIHASIEHAQGRYYLTDEKSTNGTYFRDRRIYQRHLLENGTSFRIQEYLLTFVEDFHIREWGAGEDLTTVTIINGAGGNFFKSLWPKRQPVQTKSLRQKAARLLRLINDLNTISGEDSPAAIVLDALMEATEAKRGIVALAQKQGALSLLHAQGFDGQDSHRQVSLRIVQQVVDSGAVVHDGQADGKRPATQTADVQIQSVLCVPLVLASQTIGGIYLDDPDTRLVFSETDRDLLSAVADQIADVFLRERRQSGKLAYKDEQLAGDLKKQGIIASSPKTVKIFRDCQDIARYNVSVLIFGETGTGKEVIARYIHDQSGRKGQFIARNCSAIPASMFESELFGHEKGAFTGAVEQKPGILELAHNGTLFLDEIGDMPFESQAKLLRALQDKEIWRIGSRTPLQTDVRIIAATHKDIKTRRHEIHFRDDLYYRLANVEITAPSLRERPEDIAPLCELLLATFSDEHPDKKAMLNLSPKALRLLEAYDWPGNIRELHNILIQLRFKCDSAAIEPRHLKGLIDVFATPSESRSRKLLPLAEIERVHIIKVLEHTQWNKSAAAKVLDIDRNRLNRRLKALDIQAPQ